MKKKSERKMLKKWIQLFISIAGLCFIFYKVPFAEISAHWNSKAIPWCILMLLVGTLTMLVQANRWRGLSVQGEKIPFRIYYAFIAIGYFFNNILPSGFGGDAVKSIAFGKKYNQTSQSVSAVLISRIQGLLAMFFVFFTALPFALSKVQIPFRYTILMSVFALFCLLLIIGCFFSDKITLPKKMVQKISFIQKLQESLSVYRNHKKQLVLSALDSIYLQVFSFLTSFACFKAVGIDIDIFVLIVFTNITIVIAMLPISINGIGIREGTQVALFTGILGIPASEVLSAGLLGYIPVLFQALQGAIVLMFQKK